MRKTNRSDPMCFCQTTELKHTKRRKPKIIKYVEFALSSVKRMYQLRESSYKHFWDTNTKGRINVEERKCDVMKRNQARMESVCTNSSHPFLFGKELCWEPSQGLFVSICRRQSIRHPKLSAIAATLFLFPCSRVQLKSKKAGVGIFPLPIAIYYSLCFP